MKKLQLYLKIAFLFSLSSSFCWPLNQLFAQDLADSIISSCNCSKKSINFHEYYKKKESFVPKQSDEPITIHVNFNIWQRADGSGNLRENKETKSRIEQIFKWANGYYSNVVDFGTAINYPINILKDSKIRIQLDSIFFYRNPSPDSLYYNNNGKGYPSNNFLEQYIKLNHPDRLRAINYHLTAGKYPGAGGIYEGNALQSFYKTNPEMADSTNHDFWFSQHIAHELAHALGLVHTYDNPRMWGNQNCEINGDDFLWDVYDTTSKGFTCPGNTCNVCLIPANEYNNNIMGGGQFVNYHISDLQKGIMHRHLRTYNHYGWTESRGIKDHATAYFSSPYEIEKDETWDFPLKFYQNILVKSGTTLTIKCEVQFVPQAKIIVEPCAKLVIDGGKLTNENYYRSLWQGIEVHENRNTSQNTEKKGVVEILNKGTIENAKNGIRTIAKEKKLQFRLIKNGIENKL